MLSSTWKCGQLRAFITQHLQGLPQLQRTALYQITNLPRAVHIHPMNDQYEGRKPWPSHPNLVQLWRASLASKFLEGLAKAVAWSAWLLSSHPNHCVCFLGILTYDQSEDDTDSEKDNFLQVIFHPISESLLTLFLHGIISIYQPIFGPLDRDLNALWQVETDTLSLSVLTTCSSSCCDKDQVEFCFKSNTSSHLLCRIFGLNISMSFNSSSEVKLWS